METLYLLDRVDYSGTRVETNKPVSFFSGHSCTYVPKGVSACDHLVEQISPAAVWGLIIFVFFRNYIYSKLAEYAFPNVGEYKYLGAPDSSSRLEAIF